MTTARTPTHSTSQPPSGDVAAIVSVIAMIASPSRDSLVAAAEQERDLNQQRIHRQVLRGDHARARHEPPETEEREVQHRRVDAALVEDERDEGNRPAGRQPVRQRRGRARRKRHRHERDAKEHAAGPVERLRFMALAGRRRLDARLEQPGDHEQREVDDEQRCASRTASEIQAPSAGTDGRRPAHHRAHGAERARPALGRHRDPQQRHRGRNDQRAARRHQQPADHDEAQRRRQRRRSTTPPPNIQRPHISARA